MSLASRSARNHLTVLEWSLSLTNDQSVAWLIEAALRYHGKAISIATLQSMAVIYPFVLDRSLAYVISISSMLELMSDGSREQLVKLRAST